MTKPLDLGTRGIGIKPALNVLHGLRYARETGRAPNLFVTVNLSKMGVTSDDAGAFFSTFRAKVRRAWKHQREGRGLDIGQLDDVVAHENPSGNPHVHWVVRVPDALRPWFEKRISTFLKKMAETDDLGTALEIRDVYALGGLAKYILKGIVAEAGSHFYIDPQDQGVVIGRRTLVSRSLGQTARKSAAWKRTKRPKAVRRPRAAERPQAGLIS